MTLYNIIFTALPVFFLGLFEKDIKEGVVMQHPQAYRDQRNLKYGTLLIHMGQAMLHSLGTIVVEEDGDDYDNLKNSKLNKNHDCYGDKKNNESSKNDTGGY